MHDEERKRASIVPGVIRNLLNGSPIYESLADAINKNELERRAWCRLHHFNEFSENDAAISLIISATATQVEQSTLMNLTACMILTSHKLFYTRLFNDRGEDDPC